MKYKFNNVEPIITTDPYYDLFEGGYIKPYELLKNGMEADHIRKAVDTIEEFLAAAEAAGVLEVE